MIMVWVLTINAIISIVTLIMFIRHDIKEVGYTTINDIITNLFLVLLYFVTFEIPIILWLIIHILDDKIGLDTPIFKKKERHDNESNNRK